MATDEAFFAAQSTTGPGKALWITDGTASGTRQIQVAGASSLGLDPDDLVVSASGTLFFKGTDSSGKSGLWVSDGTDAGTYELQVPNASPSGLEPTSIAAFGNGVAFTSAYLGGLWLSDGTAAGTTKLNVLATSETPGGSYYVSSIVTFDGKLYFSSETTDASSGLWVSDGTAAGTYALPVPTAASFGLTPTSIASIGTKLVLNGVNDDIYPGGFWVSDGTAAGTVELQVPGLDPASSAANMVELSTGAPNGFFSFGTKAAFVAADASQPRHEGVWVTDGTVAGTQELPGATVGTWGAPMAALSGGRLAFIAADSSGASGVWVTDGTAAGTQELHPAGAASNFSPTGLIALDGRVLFDGLDASGVSRLWTSDGTSAGTAVLLSGPITLQDRVLTPQQAFVTVLYEGLLGRTPGQNEVQGWTNLIDAGTPETTVAQAFLSSSEYQSISDNQFVTSLYQSFLGRTPGPSEVLGWTTAQTNGASQAQVVAGFDDSAEAQQRFATQITGEDANSAFVTILYQGLLGRTATPTEVQGWANVLNSGQSQAIVAQDFLSSAEYQSISNSQFVEGLYQSMLGRTAGPTEVQDWTSLLADGAPRAQIVAGFDLSPEAQQRWASIISPTSSG